MGNLGWDTGTNEVLAAFRPHGAIDACAMVDKGTGNPKGIAFVNFPDAATAQNAMGWCTCHRQMLSTCSILVTCFVDAMAGTLIQGRHIRISFAALSKRDEQKRLMGS